MYSMRSRSQKGGKRRDDEASSGSGEADEHATDREQQGKIDTSKGRNTQAVHKSAGGQGRARRGNKIASSGRKRAGIGIK